MEQKSLSCRRAAIEELPLAAGLAAKLWPHHSQTALEEEYRLLLESPEAVCLLAYVGDVPVGFAQAGLRHDYVEGTESSPVGYLEGIYVEPQFRRQGIAGALLAACEAWSRAQGCTEFASDCELDNSDSLRFHLALGFGEANRIICFRKPL